MFKHIRGTCFSQQGRDSPLSSVFIPVSLPLCPHLLNQEVDGSINSKTSCPCLLFIPNASTAVLVLTVQEPGFTMPPNNSFPARGIVSQPSVSAGLIRAALRPAGSLVWTEHEDKVWMLVEVVSQDNTILSVRHKATGNLEEIDLVSHGLLQ